MALKLNERYPSRFNNPSTDYPQGSFKNRTTPTAKDGSYLEKDWANDKEGFFQSLMFSASIEANGAVDKVGSSQYYNALLSIISNSGVPWAKVTNKPTTLGGYGITDAYTTTQAYNKSEINIFLSGKADKATTLAGYNVPIATQLEAETGTDAIKPMTALRVAQSIVKRLVQASETVVGVSRFATLAELVTGASGYLAVCPQYLLAGFAFSFGANGYIKLPTWLTGFMIQWATTSESLSSSDYRFFPTPFPTEVFGAWLQLKSDIGFGANSGTVLQVVDQNRYLWNAGGTFGPEGRAFLIALGR